jgi:hypothetical protein
MQETESKYKLAFCTIFNAYIHGKTVTSSPNIDSHYLIIRLMQLDVFYNSQEFTISMQMMNISREFYYRYLILNKQWTKHPVIRNYKSAVSKKNYISLEIIEHIELEGGEHVAIHKTFWLRIFQRKWKKYYQYKMQRMRKLLKPRGLLLREIGIGAH